MKLIPLVHYLLTFWVFLPLSIAASPEYVGAQVCKACHIQQHQQWQGSHHDLAMQEVNAETVLGDFSDVTFSKNGIKSRFFKKNSSFIVNTEGSDGKLHDYEISYVFGVYPLQQYMVKFPQGKVQVLDIAWDSRTKEQDGQRWFSLHPDEDIKAGDVLHWTGPNLNWNYMCADCHSTNLKKNYSAEDKSYATKWDEINVSCESCHGPASEHIDWSQKPADKRNKQVNGLTAHLVTTSNRHWTINTKTRKPELSDKAGTGQAEMETCAKCHSRRAQLDDDFIPGDKFREHYLPSLISDSLYYPDGQIKDEVYVYASFLQSRMYQAGVTCSDCHNPHTLARKAEGDKVCLQCHLATDYVTAKHHFHKDESTGASCIACHMPATVYMGVDERNDHSFRIPRPDLAGKLATPDACTNCHQDKNSQWAAEAMKKWYGKTVKGYQQFGGAIHALEQQNKEALQLTYGVLMNDTSDIAKATVVGHLGEFPSRQTLMTAMQMLRSKDADIRRQAIQALQAFPLQHTIAEIYAALNDPVKIVRIAAAQVLAAIPRGSLEKEQQELIGKVTEEYRQSLLFVAERPEAQLSLAQLYGQLGQFEKAEVAFKEALILQSQYIPAYVNYANFLQQQKKEQAAFAILQQGLKVNKDAALYHALGLWYVRNKDKEQGIKALQTAAELEPGTVTYQYVYAIAVSEKQPEQAIKILETALQKHTGNIELLTALSSYYHQLGNEANAVKYRNKAESVMRY
ncbi:MAG: ammonia-forming cytochrome c nitrite reductase subunit c552, partial [Methyloprofundus sp.]|nr:ammonia-forming cytochrome c nitrite reductase subunit c552 [Methyloprofundus sp.]